MMAWIRRWLARERARQEQLNQERRAVCVYRVFLDDGRMAYEGRETSSHMNYETQTARDNAEWRANCIGRSGVTVEGVYYPPARIARVEFQELAK